MRRQAEAHPFDLKDITPPREAFIRKKQFVCR